MLRKDYIQRQFEEFGKVLAAILSRKKSKDWEAFEKELEEATRKFTPMELEKLEEMTEEEFIPLILDPSRLQYEQKKILASLLFEKMNAYLERDQNKKYLALKAKCRIVYEALKNDLTQNEYDLEVHYRLDLLKK